MAADFEVSNEDWAGAVGQISVLEGYDAMFAFLEAYWERGMRSSDELAGMLGSLNREGGGMFAAGPPLDIALWHDWLAAVAKVRGSKTVGDTAH